MGSTEESRLRSVLERSRDLGFLGPISIEDQIAHAEGFALALEEAGIAIPRRCIDLGSGGGLPGLVLAGIWTSTSMTLMDGSVRRCAFLEEACADLGFGDRLNVRCGRAEELAHLIELRGWADLVVARSFGAPPVLAECAAGFLEVGGHLLVSEPPQDSLADRWPSEPLRTLGMGSAALVTSEPHMVAILQESTCPDRFPRRVGVPTKRPLF